MALLKWFICFAVFTVVWSDEVPEIPSVEVTHDDLLKMLPNQQEKLRALLDNLAKASEREQVAILNDYSDDLLKNLNNFIIQKAIDPVPMPDIEESFEWKMLLITYHGIMSLTDGWLQGLSTMQRRGDVTMRYEYPYLKLHVPLGFDVLMFDYSYKAQFMGLGPTGYVDGKVTGCKWTLDLTLHMVHLRLALEKYKLNDLGKISLKFHGNPLTDWMLNVFVTVTIPMVKPVIKFVVESVIGSGLEFIINFYNDLIFKLLGEIPAYLF